MRILPSTKLIIIQENSAHVMKKKAVYIRQNEKTYQANWPVVLNTGIHSFRIWVFRNSYCTFAPIAHKVYCIAAETVSLLEEFDAALLILLSSAM